MDTTQSLESILLTIEDSHQIENKIETNNKRDWHTVHVSSYFRSIYMRELLIAFVIIMPTWTMHYHYSQWRHGLETRRTSRGLIIMSYDFVLNRLQRAQILRNFDFDVSVE